jgi:hypothetical protein
MLLQGYCIEWVSSIEYPGTRILRCNKITWDIQPLQRHFYTACNAVIAHAKTSNEVLHLSLQLSYWLAILTYVTGALSLPSRKLSELNVCSNIIYRVGLIFLSNKREIVKAFIHGLGRLNFIHNFYVGSITFHYYLLNEYNSALNNLLWRHFADIYCKDKCFKNSLFRRCDALNTRH